MLLPGFEPAQFERLGEVDRVFGVSALTKDCPMSGMAVRLNSFRMIHRRLELLSIVRTMEHDSVASAQGEHQDRAPLRRFRDLCIARQARDRTPWIEHAGCGV